MVMKREGGFTLVEIGLVMAVSAGLLLIAGSLYTMSGNQRFTDSLQTTRTFIQQQYNDVRSSISLRVGGHDSPLCPTDGRDLQPDKAAGNNQSCLIMGKLIQFEDDRMTSSYIIGKPPVGSDWPNASKTALENIRDMSLFAITSPSAERGVRPIEKLYPNGSEAITTLACSDKDCRDKREYAPSDRNANLVILRSPLDGSILTFAYVTLVPDGASGRISNIGSNSYLGLVLALRSGGLGVSTGSLCVPVASTSSGIQTAAPAEGLNGSTISDSKALFSVCSVEVD